MKDQAKEIDLKLTEYLEKGGKAAKIGEIRQWSSGRYIKHQDGWVPVNKEPEKDQNVEKPKINHLKEVSKEVPTKDSNEYVTRKSDGKKARLDKSYSGKASKVPYKSPINTNTNIVGSTAFGKASKAMQIELNSKLHQSEILLSSLNIKLKKPIDFVCKNVNSLKRTAASYVNLKDKYEANDRIIIGDTTNLSKSFIHEIGHAIDYSMTEESDGRLSFFNKNKDSNDFNKLVDLMKKTEFYKHSDSKSYLDNPTEVFARSFEVFAYDKALKLIDENKLDKSFLDAFNPDFLNKKREKYNDIRIIDESKGADKDKFVDLKEKRDAKHLELKELRSKLNENFNDESSRNAFQLVLKELKSLDNAYIKIGNILSRQLNNKLVDDEANIRGEISKIMEKILKNNEIKKSEVIEECPFYVGVCIMNPTNNKILLGKRLEDGIWTSPGGGANKGESPKQAAIREVFEESKIELKESDLIELPSQIADNGKKIHSFMSYKSNIRPDSSLDPDNEVNKWVWFSEKEIPKKMKECKNRYTTLLNAIMKDKNLIKSLYINLLKAKELPIGSISEHGGVKREKTANGWVPLKSNKSPKKEDESSSIPPEFNEVSINFVKGKQTRSNKPISLDYAQTKELKYTREDHKDAANFHYDFVERLQLEITKRSKAKEGFKPPEKALKTLQAHQKLFRRHFSASQKLDLEK